MNTYPSIPDSKKAPIGQRCVAFYKYDGSNMRWEWSKKRGFHKFGTRTRLFDETDQVFGEGVPLFMDTMAQPIQERVLDVYGSKLERFTAFGEFLGKNSFAGSHIKDDEKYLKLFDVTVFKKGFIDPKLFVQMFGEFDFTAEEVYRGPLTEGFINSVRNSGPGQLPGYDLNEGVIVKGGEGHKLWMTKIKTYAYLAKLKESVDNWQNFWE